MERFHPPPPRDTPDAPAGHTGRASSTRAAAALTAAVCAGSPLVRAWTGDETWYALPLFGAIVVAWATRRVSARDIGLRSGRGVYGRATLLPLAIVGSAVWIATILGATRVGTPPLATLALQVSTMAILTTLGTVVSEDGFFRGALWGLLERAGRSADAILLWTATASMVWALPLFAPQAGATQALAVHALNLWLLALGWGILRLLSGSLLVAAWAHGLWNGLAYTLFGFGGAAGALGVADPVRFDPERGWLGVALNATAVLVLRRWWRAAEMRGAEADLDEASAP